MYTKCGIGAAIFHDNGTWAAVSNVTWDSGTTAVSSGLSKSGCDNKRTKSASLIFKKYAAIESETASGSGQHLTALMDLNQCNDQSQKVIMNGIRNDFSGMIEVSGTYDSLSQLDKAKNYYTKYLIRMLLVLAQFR